MYIFGYGSLIWKNADFPYSESEFGYIDGYIRRFYQGSHDHRGTPDKPGRVVTLLPSTSGRVYGRVFKIEPHQVESVIAKLDYREKNGYSSLNVLVTTPTRQVEALVYIANQDNEAYLGHSDDIAGDILRSHGPSGSNLEYFNMLWQAHQQHFPGVVDEHLQDIADSIKLLQSSL